MGFVLSKLLWSVLVPGNLLLLLMALGVLRLGWTRRRRGLRLVTVPLVLFFLIAALPLGQWLALPLESRFPRPALPAHIDGIIVLGGAVESGLTEAHGTIAFNDAAERVVEGVALARRHPEAKVLLSGGDAALLPRGDAEADVTRDFFVAEGIDPARIIVEDRSRTTAENARFSHALVHPAPGQVWVLVTSAAHMPRAIGCFRRLGWAVLPDPVDYRGEDRPRPGFFLSEHLALFDVIVKEWVGLAVYRVLDRTDALFPAPEGG